MLRGPFFLGHSVVYRIVSYITYRYFEDASLTFCLQMTITQHRSDIIHHSD